MKKKFVKDLKQAAQKTSHGKVHVGGANISRAAITASINDMIAISQYFAHELVRHYPSVYDVGAPLAPEPGVITPSGVASYIFCAMVQAANKLGQNNSTISSTINCFPEDFPVPVVIAEWIRSYFSVKYAPNLVRTLSITSDIPISNGSITPWTSSSGLSMSVNQFQLGTGLDQLSVFSRTLSGTSGSIYYDRSLTNTTFNYTGVFTGATPFVTSPEFRIIATKMASWSKVGTIPFKSVNLVAPDYSAFIDPVVSNPNAIGTTSAWTAVNYYNCPSAKYNPCLGPVFQPNSGLAYAPRVLPSQQYTCSPIYPTIGVKGNFLSPSNVINNAVIPPNQTPVSEYVGKFFYVLMGAKSQVPGFLFGKKGHKLFGRFNVNLDKIVGKTIDLCKLSSHLIGNILLSLSQNYTNMSYLADDLNLLYNAAMGMLCARIFETGQPELFNLTGCVQGTAFQQFMPDEDYLAKTMPPLWALIHNMIGAVKSGDHIAVPVLCFAQIANGVAINNYTNSFKFGMVNISGCANSFYSNPGIGTFNTNSPFCFGVFSAVSYGLPNGGIQTTVVEATSQISSSTQTSPINMVNSVQVQGPIGASTLGNYNASPKVSGISSQLIFWSDFAPALMIYINNIYSGTSGVNKSVMVPRTLGKIGHCNMYVQALSYTSQAVAAGGLTGAGYNCTICTPPTVSGQPFTVSATAVIAFPYVEKRYLFDIFVSSAKLLYCSTFALCTTYYANNNTQIVVSGRYEHQLPQENNQTLAIQFATDICSEGSVIMKKYCAMKEKKKVDAFTYDHNVSKEAKNEKRELSKDILTNVIKDYMTEHADPQPGVTIDLDKAITTAEHIRDGGNKDPDLYVTAELVDDPKKEITADDFNWKKAIITTAKAVSTVVPLLLA